MSAASLAPRRQPAAARFARIEDAAADWLARREAGLTVDELAEFSRWLLADPRHAAAAKQLESNWRFLQKPRCTGQAGDVLRTIEAAVERRARRWQRRVLTGALWGTLAAAAALVIGHTGREGKLTGALFSLLALATFARMAVVAAQFNKDPQFAALLGWTPVAVWALAGALLLLLVPMQRRAPA